MQLFVTLNISKVEKRLIKGCLKLKMHQKIIPKDLLSNCIAFLIGR